MTENLSYFSTICFAHNISYLGKHCHSPYVSLLLELKCLRDVDLNIQEKIGNRLTKKKPGTPTWIQLAIKYAMEDHLIASLENNQETAGREVIEFLANSYPKLTVYEVCKVLKDKDIRSFDMLKYCQLIFRLQFLGGDVRL